MKTDYAKHLEKKMDKSLRNEPFLSLPYVNTQKYTSIVYERWENRIF